MKKLFNIVLLVLCLVFLKAGLSYADWGDQGYNHGGYNHSGYDHSGNGGYYRHDHGYDGYSNYSSWPTIGYIQATDYTATDGVLVSDPTPVAVEDMSNQVTLNIPNKQGGYTAVTLTRSGSGFIGPQGEFYAQFPSVSQLELIYGN